MGTPMALLECCVMMIIIIALITYYLVLDRAEEYIPFVTYATIQGELQTHVRRSQEY
jgi:hypothetical protein